MVWSRNDDELSGDGYVTLANENGANRLHRAEKPDDWAS